MDAKERRNFDRVEAAPPPGRIIRPMTPTIAVPTPQANQADMMRMAAIMNRFRDG